MLLHGHAFEQARDLIDGEDLWMVMVPRRPFREDRVVFLESNVIDRVLVNRAVGNVRDGAAGG